MFTTQSGLICLVLNLPDDFVLPVETDLLLQTLLPKLRVYLDTVRTGSSGGSNIAHLDHYHRILAGYFESQATLEQCQTDLGRYLPVRPAHWKDCAARSVSECPSSAASGQEMMTCGKVSHTLCLCLSVQSLVIDLNDFVTAVFSANRSATALEVRYLFA